MAVRRANHYTKEVVTALCIYKNSVGRIHCSLIYSPLYLISLSYLLVCYFLLLNCTVICRRGGVRNFNFCHVIGCVSFFVLSCVVFGGGPDVLTTHSCRPALVYLSSVLVQRLLLPLQASDPRAFGL